MIREDECVCGEDSCKEIIRDCGSKCNVCDVAGTLDIFKEFNEVYKERLKKTDEAGGDVSQLKLKTLEDWVADLTEQNTVLVETVEALEKEALFRLELGINAQRCDELEVKGDGSYARYLKKDVDNRSKRKVSESGSFDQPHVTSSHAVPCNHEGGRVCRGTSHVERGIFPSEGNDLFAGQSRARSLDPQVEEMREKLRKAEEEIDHLKKSLSANESKLEKINEEIKTSEKSAREMRAALTAEVADKHDQVLALRRDVQHLEEKLRQADMQTHFKDDIIKELRKEVKVANNKLMFLGLDVVPMSFKSPNKCNPDQSVAPSCKNKFVTDYDPAASHKLAVLKVFSNNDNRQMSCAESCLNKNESSSAKRISSSKKTSSDHRNLQSEINECAFVYNEMGKNKKVMHSHNEIRNRGRGNQQSKKLSKNTAVKNIPPDRINILEHGCGDGDGVK